MGIVRWVAAAVVTPYWWVMDRLWKREFKADAPLASTDGPALVPCEDYGAETWASVPAVRDDPTLLITTIVMLENPRRNAPLTAEPAPNPQVITGEWAEVPREQSTVEDILGEWNPDEADWTLPASIFESVADDRFNSWAELVSMDTVLAGLGAGHQESFVRFAERVLLTGV